MFRVSYIDKDNSIQHKSFKDTRSAWEWINRNTEIVPLKLLVRDELIQCYSTLEDLRK